jgi:TDG/mug DNA glycosylase family protein
MEMSEGFPPVVGENARILILGSLPGRRSLADQEYYAHPQNAFWPIMAQVFDISGNYVERCAGLTGHGVALWDVLQASVRPGSLDADISLDTAAANDFAAFLQRYSSIEKILFNGKKAEQLFQRLVAEKVSRQLCLTGLPSTSPAYAAMPFRGKLTAWQVGLTLTQPKQNRSVT